MTATGLVSHRVPGVLAVTGMMTVGLGLGLHLVLAMGMTFLLVAALVWLAGAACILCCLPQLGPGRFGAANVVTTLRAGLVALLAGMVTEAGAPVVAWVATGLALLALAMDGLDGWLARRLNLASAFGARFDMEVDAVLIVVLALLALAWDRAGPWVLLSGLMRYGFVLAGAFRPVLAGPLPPSLRRKLVCVVQILALIVILPPLLAPPVATGVAALSLLLLAWSFMVDTIWLLRHG